MDLQLGVTVLVNIYPAHHPDGGYLSLVPNEWYLVRAHFQA